MKCPKCNYVSHDYLDMCRKCGVDLVAFKQDMGLLVLQPSVLDLGLVLGEAGADDLFESVEEDVTMPADNDDFEIRLDDSDQPGARRAQVGAPRAGARALEEIHTGLEHLTLELDVASLLEPSTPTAPPPPVPEANTLPPHVTLEIAPESIAAELSPDVLEESALVPPPHTPETTVAQDISRSLSLDVSSIDWASITSATDLAERSERGQSVDEEPTERIDARAEV